MGAGEEQPGGFADGECLESLASFRSGRDAKSAPQWMGTRREEGRLRSQMRRRSSGGSLGKRFW